MKDIDLEMYGGFSSVDSVQYALNIRLCQNSSENGNHCKPIDDIFALSRKVQIRIYTLTEYFDTEEFDEDPIKSTI